MQIMGGAAEAKNSLSKMATDVSTWQVCHLPYVPKYHAGLSWDLLHYGVTTLR